MSLASRYYRMKTLASILAGVMLAITVNAQTNLPPTPPAVTTNTVPSLPEHVNTWLNFLSNTATNWVVSPYAIYVDDEVNSIGGGVAALYEVSPYVLTGMRLDFFDDSVFMPSIGAQLQLPIKLANKITVTPFVISGVATPLGGGIEQDTEAVVIVGGGVAASITKKIGLVYDAEMWSGFSGTQHRFGIFFKF